jgi:hypothetical protein
MGHWERSAEDLTDRYYAAACQIDLPHPKHRDEIASRVDRMLDLIKYSVTGYEPCFDVRLVVFPEYARPVRFRCLPA